MKGKLQDEFLESQFGNAIDFLKDKVEKQKEDIEKYRKEIIELRGKAHLSCPNCYEDCMGWVAEGKPCGNDWGI